MLTKLELIKMRMYDRVMAQLFLSMSLIVGGLYYSSVGIDDNLTRIISIGLISMGFILNWSLLPHWFYFPLENKSSNSLKIYVEYAFCILMLIWYYALMPGIGDYFMSLPTTNALQYSNDFVLGFWEINKLYCNVIVIAIVYTVINTIFDIKKDIEFEENKMDRKEICKEN